MTQEPNASDLEQDAAGLMRELTELTAKLRDAGKAEAKAQLDDLQARIAKLASDSEALTKIDKSVRANPYLYILGALGIGVLLGKSLRS